MLVDDVNDLLDIAGVTPAKKSRVLLVDDTESIRYSLGAVLEYSGFEVVTAANVKEALKFIGAEAFDVLLSDLHMPQAGDGLTVVSAMRHSNPKAVTIILSGYPEMKQAAAAIVLQADEILIKPIEPRVLVEAIRNRLADGVAPTRAVETVAAILENESKSTIEN